VNNELSMKAILLFNLPEEQQEFRLANEAADWHSEVMDRNLKLH
jgi:hypothetical protein